MQDLHSISLFHIRNAELRMMALSIRHDRMDTDVRVPEAYRVVTDTHIGTIEVMFDENEEQLYAATDEGVIIINAGEDGLDFDDALEAAIEELL